MAKQKQKKVQKELEKLQRTGRYWEWLVSVQNQPSTPDLKREIEQTWKEIQRRTLRSAASFDEFCLHVDTVRDVPVTPDMEFLKALKAVAEGSATSDALFLIKGLSPSLQAAADSLRSKMQSGLDRSKIESLLTRMAREPANITRKHYNDLAEALSGTPLEEPLQVLSDEISVFRRLNHKTALKKSLGEQFLESLYESDSEIAEAVEYLPASLMKLLLLPFCTQILLHLKNCAVRPDSERLGDLFNALEFLYPLVAGDKKQKIDGAFLSEEAESFSRKDLQRMERDFAAAGFEGKLNLLRDFRQGFHEFLSSDKAHHPYFIFDGFPDLEATESLLLKFYEQVLKEIARLSPTLSNRDRRALPDTMDTILTEDVEALFLEEANPQPMAELLLHAAEAGCLGKRLAMLGILTSRWDKTRKLLPLATQALRNAPLPSKADTEWLFKEWGQLVLKSIKSLAVIFDRVRDHEETVNGLAFIMWSFVNTAFFSNTLLHSPGASRSSRMGDGEPVAIGIAQAKELEQLAAQEEKLGFLRDYLSIFPDRRISPENLYKWLELTWADKALHECFFETLLVVFASTPSFLRALSVIPELAFFRSTLSEGNQTKTVLDFFKAHVEDFRTLPLETVERVLEILFEFLEGSRNDGTLLLRLYNVFAARTSAGEEEFARISDDLKARLKASEKTVRPSKPKSRSRSKKKR